MIAGPRCKVIFWKTKAIYIQYSNSNADVDFAFCMLVLFAFSTFEVVPLV